jgi:hypothetical protein
MMARTTLTIWASTDEPTPARALAHESRRGVAPAPQQSPLTLAAAARRCRFCVGAADQRDRYRILGRSGMLDRRDLSHRRIRRLRGTNKRAR